MRALEFITGHVIYNPAYTYKFQLKTTIVYFKTFALIQSTVMLPEKYVTLPRCVKVFFW